MLKNKFVGRKIRNTVILLMIIAVIVGIYRFIDRSRAENVKEISAIALDDYGYLENEQFLLEARQGQNGLYEIEMPESINGKKINQIIKVTLENSEDETTEKNDISEDTQENVLEIKENAIQLTKEQIETQEINLEVVYDVAILEKNEKGEYEKELLSGKSLEELQMLQQTEKTQMLYNKILKYEDEKNGKVVELKGFLPKDAQIQIEELSKEDIQSIFGNEKITVAYDIKIIMQVISQMPVDEANPESKIEEIVEIVEINPEDFGETCEVTIKDVNIIENSQVYHVKEDNTIEEVKVKENTSENISFEAKTFSVYAITEGASTRAATGLTVGMCYSDGSAYISDTNDTAGATGPWTTKTVFAAREGVKVPSLSGLSGYTVQISKSQSSGYSTYSYNTSSDMYKISTEGTHTRYFRAVSGSSVVGPIALTARIDWTAPTATNGITTNEYYENGIYYTNKDSITWYVSPQDNVSGLKGAYMFGYHGTTWSNGYRTGDDDTSLSDGSYSATMAFNDLKDSTSGNTGNGEGEYTLDATVTDNAGNTGNVTGATIVYDKTRPTLTVTNSAGYSIWENDPVKVKITVQDPISNGVSSGLKSTNTYQYCLLKTGTTPSSSDWKTYTSGSQITLNPGVSGEYKLYIKPIGDKAGNLSTTSSYHSFDYKFDYDAPTSSGGVQVNITPNEDGNYYTNQSSVTWHIDKDDVSDAHSRNSICYLFCIWW